MLTARRHAEEAGLDVDYRAVAAETLAASDERFDVVLAMEIIEHVADLDAFLAAAAALVRPGGAFVAATLNRTAKSYLFAIVGAEYVLGWLPRGTHDWNRFATPDELARYLQAAGFAAPRFARLFATCPFARLFATLRFARLFAATAALTQTIGGRPSAISLQLAPSSREAYTRPLRVPK
jgi:2-polyprenyl-6-hydroxyphenyl methylase/3-demethylubiquinone-9 3-methyltransferase